MRYFLILLLFLGCTTDTVEVPEMQTRDISTQYSVPLSECEAYSLPSDFIYEDIVHRFNATGPFAGDQYNSGIGVIVQYSSYFGGSIAIGRLLRYWYDIDGDLVDYTGVRYTVNLYEADEGLIETFCVRPGYWIAFHPINLKPKGKPGTVNNYRVEFPDYPQAKPFYFSVSKGAKSEGGCQPHCWNEPHNGNCWQITPDGAYKHCPTPPGCNDKDQ